MSLLMSIGLVVQVLSAIALIVLVLLQHGKGADLGAAFGSGASGSIFGAAGSGSFLSKMTWIIGAVFFLSTIAITIGSGAFAHHNARQASDNGGVLGTLSSVPADVSAPAAAPSAPAAAPSAPAASALLPRLRLPPIRLILGITLPPLPKTKFLGKITILRDAQNKTAQNVLTI